MNAFVFLVKTLFDLYIMVVLLRIWLQWARADFYNPFSQFVVKATQPVLKPLRRVIPALGPIDTASVLFALVLTMAKIVAITLIAGGGLPPWLPLLITTPLALIQNIFDLVLYVVIAGVILSWVMQGYNPIAMAIGQLTEPLLRPIRRLLPNLGGLDFSPMVLLLGLYFLKLLIADMTGIHFG
ncbi:YggT family protein [Gallaecimonas sp. GXIMD4217]|uniref:YggT family protein n=1 Tax=Gallaecimonas sp. GXIMD4217 TaxID=3131927 RepID=UPI00311B41B5